MIHAKLSIIFLMLFVTGCATSSTPYLTARYHDALDIFTFTSGEGAGFKLMAGPFSVGEYFIEDQHGIRGGVRSNWWPHRIQELMIFPMIIPMVPEIMRDAHDKSLFGIASVPCRTCYKKRAVSYYVLPVLSYTRPKWLALPRKDGNAPEHINPDKNEHAWQYLTQCEMAAGLGWTGRIGVNPGELLDFILGWTTLDIYGDDSYPNGFEMRAEKEE